MLDVALLRNLIMIDSSKKQQQGFPEILPVGDIELLKEKECLDTNSQKSLKEGQFFMVWGGKSRSLLIFKMGF